MLLVPDDDGYRLKLVDFGLALEQSQAAFTISEVAGTLGYIAPEILRGEPVSEAADLYALGVLAYQLIAGCHPFGELTGSALIAAVLSTDPPRAPLGAPAGLAAWVLRLLSRAPEQRFSGASQALHALALAAGRPLAIESAATRESILQGAPFVGRAAELETLGSALEQTHQARGKVFLIGGESGVGKSRLLEELRTLALVSGVRVLRAHAETTGASRQQFLGLLRALVLDLPLDDLEAAVIKSVLPELPTLLGRPVPDAPAAGPQEMLRRSMHIIVGVFTRLQTPTLMILDDLQWASLENLGILREVALRVHDRPLLIVGSYRSEEAPELPKRVPSATVLQLRRLDLAAIRELSVAMLGPAGRRPDLLEFLIGQTEGNIFFLIEVVRALAEEAGSLEAVGTRQLPQQVVAGGVSAVVRRRLERVPKWAQPLLRAAAVAGRQVDLAVFRVLDPRLDQWLQVCLDCAVLEVHDAQWRFSHDKLRDALLATLPPDEKRRLHQQLGETIEQVYASSGTHEVALAYHFEQAGDLAKAARLTAQAGAAALRRGALHEATELLQRARRLQQQVAAPLLERCVNLRRLVRVYYAVDRRADCLETCREGLELLGRPIPSQPGPRMFALLREVGVELRNRVFGAPAAQDERERALATELVALVRTTADTLFTQSDVALLVMLFALHAAEQSGDKDAQADYLSWLGYAAYSLPLHPLGRLYLRRAAALLPPEPQSRLRSDYHPFVGYLHQGEGDWERSREAFTAWLQRMQQSQNTAMQCLAYCTRSSASAASGHLEEALQDADRCAELAHTLGNAYYTGVGLAYRAVVLHYRGQAAGADELVQKARQHLSHSRNNLGRATVGGFAALTALRTGQLELARKCVDESLALMARSAPRSPQLLEGYCAALEVALHFFLSARAPDESVGAGQRLRKALYHQLRFALRFPVARPRALLTLARLAWSREQVRLAERIFTLGLASARRRNMPYEQALAHLWLGRVAQARGPSADSAARARAHLSAAEKLLSEGGYALELPEVRSLLSRL